MASSNEETSKHSSSGFSRLATNEFGVMTETGDETRSVLIELDEEDEVFKVATDAGATPLP